MAKPDKKRGYRYRELNPPPEVQNVLEKLWVFDSADYTKSDPHFNLLCDYTSSLIITFPQQKEKTEIYLTGPNSRNIPFRNFPHLQTIGARFHPMKMQYIFGISTSVLRDKAVKLKDLILPQKARSFKDRLVQTVNTNQRFSVVTDFIRSLLPSVSFSAGPLETFVNKIIESDGTVKLEKEYSRFTISPRQFQRNFAKATGLTPKEFCRLVRFHSVTRKLVKNDFRHFDTLVESGYYDQSHYYREFRDFLGMLPSKFEARQKRIALKYLVK